MPKKEIPGYKQIKIFDPFLPARVKYKDVFDLKMFYDTLHEWLLEYEWKDIGDDLDHWETFYGEILGPGGFKNSMLITWKMWKNAAGDRGYSDSFKFYLDVYFRCIAIKKIEVIKDGKKMNVNKGEVEMKIHAYIEEEYKDKFYNTPMLKPFMNLFSNRVYRKTVKQYEKALYQETQAFLNFIKQYLKLKRYLPYEETKSFFPRYAWPSHQKGKEEE
tara:strand:+ start:1577 stop:2227 length:651 start_codon:yes stop_codon:yes gene_type:complete